MNLKTIQIRADGLYKEKGSKFYSYLFPINSEDEVKRRTQQLRSQFHKASHVCFAARIGYSQPFEMNGDDGEPRNTAGAPILNQLRSNELTNIALHVVRFYGGSKLGKSGLINAYKLAALSAIEKAIFHPLIEYVTFPILFKLADLGAVERITQQHGIEIVSAIYNDPCTMLLKTSQLKRSEMKKLFSVIPSLKEGN
ncbi:MAG: YigZ family protein [Vicingaceae bacterium]